MNLNRHSSVITDVDEKRFIFEYIINSLVSGYVRLPQLEYSFFRFASFFLFFFLFWLPTFKPLNALYSKFERLKISGRTRVRLKLEVPGWVDLPQLGPPKF